MSKTKKKQPETESDSEDEASNGADSDSSESNSSTSSSSSSDKSKKASKKSSKTKKSKRKSSNKDKKKKKRKHQSSESDSDDSSSSSSSDSDGKPSNKKKRKEHEQTNSKKKNSDHVEIETKRVEGRRGSETRKSRSLDRNSDGGNGSKWDSPGRDGRRFGGGGGGYQNNRNNDRRGGNNWNRGWNNDWRNNRDNGYRGRDGFGGNRDRDWERDRRDEGQSSRGRRHQDDSRRNEERGRNEERERNDDKGRKEERGRNETEDRRPFDRSDNRDRGDRNDRQRHPDREKDSGRRRSRSPRKARNFPRRDNADNDREFEWGGRKDETRVKKEEDQSPTEKEKPNFGLSGKLTEDTNTVNGVVVKYAEPPEARKPKRRWRLYPFKGEKALPTLHIHRQSCFLIGRDRKVCDLAVDHPSCSKQHAALQYRLVPFTREDGTTGRRVRPYAIDLESANGTFLNSKKIDPKRYVELMEKDVLKFGFSSREYVLLHENSKEDEDDDDVKQEADDGIEIKNEPQ